MCRLSHRDGIRGGLQMQVHEGMRDKCVLLQPQGNLLGEGATVVQKVVPLHRGSVRVAGERDATRARKVSTRLGVNG